MEQVFRCSGGVAEFVSDMGDVECRYCGTFNSAEEHRCTRCNRRLHLASPRPAPDFAGGGPGITATATAPAFDMGLEMLPGGAQPSDPEKNEPERSVYQAWLFRESTHPAKVIPIPTLTPLRPQVRETSVPHSSRRAAPPRSRRTPDSQRALDFHAPADAGMGLQMEVIYCDAPVALPTHRAMAAVVDLSLVLVALGMFLGMFFLTGGDIVLNRETMPLLGGTALVIGLFYRLLWCLGNGDTPGMRFAGLRLVDFDGRRPNREQRGLRQLAGLLSILSVGLGLVWALVDEENLTWHDHISKTFPTPV